MAPFNPDVKDVKPVNPIGWSHSAEVPGSFASGLSEAIKGIGSTIQLGAKAGVDLVEQNIDTAARDKIEPIKNDRIAELAGEDFRLKLGLGERPSTDTASITEGNVSDLAVPGDLKREIKSLSILPDARANGKISPSDYYGRLMAASSDLRSRYPVGFRDYIDKEISKITGVDPANAYMQSLTADINANQTHVQAERNKIASEILTLHGKDPTAPQAYENFRNGGSIREATNWISRVKAVDVKHERIMADLAEKSALDKSDETSAERSFTEFAALKVATTSKNVSAVNGLSSEKIREITINQLQNKGEALTSEQFLSLANAQRGFMEANRAALVQELNFVDTNPNSKTYRPVPLARILGEKGNKIIENALSSDAEIVKQLSDGKIGLVMNTKLVTEALQNDSANIYWKDPAFQKQFGFIKALETAGGQGAVTQGWASAVSTGLPDVQKVSIQTKIANLATAPDPRGPQFKDVNNLKDAIQKVGDEADKLGDDRYKFKTMDQVIKLIDGKDSFSITDPTTKPQVVTNLFKNFFSPDTRGALRLIQTDMKDPRTGQVIPGQESWYKRMTSPEVVAKAAIQDDITKNDYLTWTQMTFKDIFTNSINNLGAKEFTGAYTVSWDLKDPVSPLKVSVNNLQAMGDIRRFTGKSSPIEDDIRSVNKGLTGLLSVYRGMGMDERAVERLALEQLRLQLPQLKAINGVPKDIIDTLEVEYKTKLEEEKAKEQTKAKYRP